jgi:hypothetical protein
MEALLASPLRDHRLGLDLDYLELGAGAVGRLAATP